jgi:hypothetical protein
MAERIAEVNPRRNLAIVRGAHLSLRIREDVMGTKGSGRFISVRQAARLADCGEAYVYDRIRQHSFASERIAGRLLIDRESFLAWLPQYRVRRHIPSSVTVAIEA